MLFVSIHDTLMFHGQKHLFIILFNILSTFGGNPLASAVAIAALDIVKEERLTERYIASVKKCA